MKDLPLGLPKGSVRALLALLLVGSAVASVFLEGVSEAGMSALFGLAGAVSIFYFNQRKEESNAA